MECLIVVEKTETIQANAHKRRDDIVVDQLDGDEAGPLSARKSRTCSLGRWQSDDVDAAHRPHNRGGRSGRG